MKRKTKLTLVLTICSKAVTLMLTIRTLRRLTSRKTCNQDPTCLNSKTLPRRKFKL